MTDQPIPSGSDDHPTGSRCIVVVSVGDRPWFPLLLPSMQAYADRLGADLVVHRFSEPDPQHLEWLGRLCLGPHETKLRFLKLFYLRETLIRYERVLLLDDTCYVDVSCPNIFHGCPEDCLGAVEDGGVLGRNAFPAKVYNTGVLVVSRPQLSFFNRFEQFYAQQTKRFADQLLVNQAIEAGEFKVHPMDPRFNWVGSQILETGIANRPAYIYHLTSALRPKQRLEYSRRLSVLDD